MQLSRRTDPRPTDNEDKNYEQEICYYGEQRTTRKPTGLYHALGGLCDRLRQCVEIPVDVRAVRRRELYARIPDLPCAVGNARAGHGIFSGSCGTDQPDLYVSETDKARHKMGCLGIHCADRQYCADGILLRGDRLDRLLFLPLCDRLHRLAGLRPHDQQPRHQRDLPAGDSGSSVLYSQLQSAGRTRARDQIHDVRAPGASSGTRRAQPAASRRGAGPEILPDP